MSNFHPDATRMTEYAAGAVSYHEALLISVHLEYCASCRHTAEKLQTLGGILFDDLAPEPVGDNLLAATLAQLDAEPPRTTTAADASPGATTDNTLPRPLRKLVPQGYGQLGWKRILPQLQACDIDTSPDGLAISLHRIRAGGRIPRHTHRGTEYTLVLRGGFSDNQGDYNPGDFLVRDGDIEHQPVAAENEECICLTVTEAPLRMTAWQWRWLNPFL